MKKAMSEAVIKVEKLAKRYRLGVARKKSNTFSEEFLLALKSPLENFKRVTSLSKFNNDDESVFWALRDISFEVKQGEVLGVIGHNGAGKSTLLKILSRITDPTDGQISIKGRVSSLLEVGTGFHPELTGRDNIFMNGTILGMQKKEINKKLDEIISFSGIEKHIDTPVKFYSSGMKVRLGFSVAAHLEPEILIIDEVLAVGDQDFQKRCLGKMESVANSGRTVLFVSHNLESVNALCSKAILLDKGKLKSEGLTSNVINEYLERFSSSKIEYAPESGDVSNKEIFINRAYLTDNNNLKKNIFPFSDGFDVNLEVFVKDPDVVEPEVSFAIISSSNIVVLNSNIFDSGKSFRFARGINRVKVCLPGFFLNAGSYFVRAFVFDGRTKSLLERKDIIDFKIDQNGIYRNAEKRNALVIPKLNWLFE